MTQWLTNRLGWPRYRTIEGERRLGRVSNSRVLLSPVQSRIWRFTERREKFIQAAGSWRIAAGISNRARRTQFIARLRTFPITAPNFSGLSVPGSFLPHRRHAFRR